jgi:hypothetical protein
VLANQVLGGLRLVQVDAKLEQLALDAGSASQRVGPKHPPNQGLSPSISGPSKPEPEEAVLRLSPWAFGFSAEGDELLA